MAPLPLLESLSSLSLLFLYAQPLSLLPAHPLPLCSTVAYWDSICGYPFHFSCLSPTVAVSELSQSAAQGATHGYPCSAEGLCLVPKWASVLPNDLDAQYMRAFV